MSVSKLTIELATAKTTQQIKKLLSICDKLSEGISVEGYTPDDLPPDSVYEQYKKKVNYNSTEIENSTIMIMSTVPKFEEIKIIGEAILYPKFDGCSVAMRIKRIDTNNFKIIQAHTRGANTGSERINHDITDKMTYLIPTILAPNLNKRIVEMCVRGEYVLKQKQVNRDGQAEINHAAQAAGSLNGKFQNFKDTAKLFCLLCYEISEIILDNNSIIVPKQINVNRKILNKIDFKYFDNTVMKSDDYNVYCVNLTEHSNLNKFYDEKILPSTQRPTDGIVYCSINWTYPQTEDKFTAANYNKYAWKPNKYQVSTAVDVEFTMSRDGELNPVVIFESTMIEGRNCCRAKIATSRLNDLIQSKQFGISSKCEIQLIHSINLYIQNVLTPSARLFEIPINCPYCNSELSYEYDSKDTNKLIHVRCNNPDCKEQRVMKLVQLIKVVGKIGDLTFLNAKGQVVKSSIAEKKIRTFDAINWDTVKKYIPNLKEEFDKLTFENQFVAMSLGGMSEAKKCTDKNISHYNLWFKFN